MSARASGVAPASVAAAGMPGRCACSERSASATPPASRDSGDAVRSVASHPGQDDGDGTAAGHRGQRPEQDVGRWTVRAADHPAIELEPAVGRQQEMGAVGSDRHTAAGGLPVAREAHGNRDEAVQPLGEPRGGAVRAVLDHEDREPEVDR